MDTYIRAKFNGKLVIIIEVALDSNGGFTCCVLNPETKKLRNAFADCLEDVEVVGLVEAVEDVSKENGTEPYQDPEDFPGRVIPT